MNCLQCTAILIVHVLCFPFKDLFLKHVCLDPGIIPHFCITYNKPTRCNSDSIVFINNYRYALHVSDALCVHHQEHYKL